MISLHGYRNKIFLSQCIFKVIRRILGLKNNENTCRTADARGGLRVAMDTLFEAHRFIVINRTFYNLGSLEICFAQIAPSLPGNRELRAEGKYLKIYLRDVKFIFEWNEAYPHQVTFLPV